MSVVGPLESVLLRVPSSVRSTRLPRHSCHISTRYWITVTKWRSHRDHRFCDVISRYVFGRTVNVSHRITSWPARRNPSNNDLVRPGSRVCCCRCLDKTSQWPSVLAGKQIIERSCLSGSFLLAWIRVVADNVCVFYVFLVLLGATTTEQSRPVPVMFST